MRAALARRCPHKTIPDGTARGTGNAPRPGKERAPVARKETVQTVLFAILLALAALSAVYIVFTSPYPEVIQSIVGACI